MTEDTVGYWHVRVEASAGSNVRKGCANDLSFDALQAQVVEPWRSSRPFTVQGVIVRPDNLSEIQIVQTSEPARAYADEHNARMRAQGIADLATDRRRLPFSVGRDWTQKLLFDPLAVAAVSTGSILPVISTSESLRASDSAPAAFDVAILCALPMPELEKVLRTGSAGWRPLAVRGNDPSSYHETTFTTADGTLLRVVAAAPTQMGMPASAVLATKMILHFRPKLVAMVGIAAGAKSDAQGYGDILAPNRTFDYNAGKLTLRDGSVHFEPDPDPVRISERIRSRLDHWRSHRIGLDEITQRWPAAKPRTRLEMHVGPMGSGAAVIDVKQPVLDILEHWRKLIGIEMEAYGVHLACQNATAPPPEFLCMKSICDFATAKTDGWQDYAAFTAAELCHQFLTQEWANLFPVHTGQR